MAFRYCAPVEGNEEDRRRADQIAREIENSQQSKFNARLENDDDERDLDKVTTEDDFEMQNKRGGGGGGQRGNFGNRNQRNGANGPPLGNRRADALKGGQDQFSLKEGNPRRDTSQGQGTRTYENKGGQNQSNKILLEPRSSASPRGAPTDPKSQPGATPTPASPSHAVETSPQDPMPSSTHDQPADPSSATASSPQTEGSSPAAASAPASNTQTTSHEATPDSTATSATTEKEEGTKKFTFNVNAPAFKPRSAQAQIQAQQVGPPPGGPPQAMMGAVPMVPAGVPIQTAMPPPGMLPTMQTGQPPVLVQWQGAPGQQYQVPYAYQSFSVQGGASGGGSAGVVPPPPPQGGFAGPQAPPPQMMPGTPQTGAPPPGIYPQRFVPAQGYVLPQAGVQGQTRFPTPQQTPHQGMDAAHFQAQGAPGSAAASTGPNSQPPTPGPSPAQPKEHLDPQLHQLVQTASHRRRDRRQHSRSVCTEAHTQIPALKWTVTSISCIVGSLVVPKRWTAALSGCIRVVIVVWSQGGRGGSPGGQQAAAMQQSVGPPPPQQFMAPASAAPPPHFYATAQPVYGMYSAPTGQGMVVYGGPGGVPMAMPPAHHDPAMMQQPHPQQAQQQQQQQQGGGVPPPPHQQYAMPHEGYGNFVQAAPFYQQPPPNQMSRQNSAPQAIYQQQGPGGPPPQQQQQQAPPNPPSTAPPPQQ
ncbi:LsmAD domain protein [Ancylostoma ceylanicum]|uniref:LsmAD domain protein n=2 Tax=Ancylostoma ceylanicum TaxID=53326 RepID=A0A0D6LQN7_9BILA|nr:LsmAD domain protein [Ancylostoma ceylanicum]